MQTLSNVRTTTTDNIQLIIHYFGNTGEIEQHVLPFLEKEQIEVVGRLKANSNSLMKQQRKKSFGNGRQDPYSTVLYCALAQGCTLYCTLRY